MQHFTERQTFILEQDLTSNDTLLYLKAGSPTLAPVVLVLPERIYSLRNSIEIR